MCFAHNLFPHPLHPCFQETFLLWRRSKLFPAYFPRQVIFPTSEACLASLHLPVPLPASSCTVFITLHPNMLRGPMRKNHHPFPQASHLPKTLLREDPYKLWRHQKSKHHLTQSSIKFHITPWQYQPDPGTRLRLSHVEQRREKSKANQGFTPAPSKACFQDEQGKQSRINSCTIVLRGEKAAVWGYSQGFSLGKE